MWECWGHESGFPRVPWGLHLSWVAEKWGRDADFVEEVSFGVGVESFAVFAEVKIDAVGTAVADATDGHYITGVARYAAMDVRVAFGLVLSELV